MEFSSLVNFVIIFIAGCFVWLSGTKLAIYSDWIGDRYKIGRAFIGALLLAFVTSLPELATTITAALIDNAPLATNNLLGGINLQTVVIGIADLLLVSGAITYFSPKPSLLIAGLFLILQLAITTVGISYGELFSIWNIGFWPFLLFVMYLFMLYFILRHEKDEKWAPTDTKVKTMMKFPVPSKKEYSNARLIFFFCINGLIVFIAGSAISYFADKLAVQWNWSGSWMGATLVALTTSLPEVSTTFGAVRQKAYVLAIANIFGSNAFTISLLFPADIFYRKGPIINSTDASNILLAGVGILITAIFLWGILNRRKKAFLRMGIDSFLVILAYCVSLVLLYRIAI